MNGIGDRLAEKFSSYGIRSEKGCSCSEVAGKLNAESPQWCRDNMPWILEKIRENSQKKGIPFIELVVKKIVNEAIDEHEEVTQIVESGKRRTFEAMVEEVLEDVRNGERVRDPLWSFKPEVVEAHRRLFRERISEIDARTETPFTGTGRGIVTLIGTMKYFPAGYVLCRMLRTLGCSLPIEAWFLGRVELDHRMENLLQELGVRCVDATQQHVAWEPRTLGGWQCKARAIAGSEFDEVLFLDADQVPVDDPTKQLERIAEHDVVAWPDFKNQWGYDCHRVAWEVLNLPVPGRSVDIPNHDKPTDYTPWETGQMFVRKSKAWKYLLASILFSDHSDWWYPQPHGRSQWPVYGDKSTFLFAALAMKQGVTMPGDSTLFGVKEGGGFDQYDLSNPDRLFFQHRCQPQSKIRITGMNSSQGLVQADLFDRSIAELKSKWKPSIWNWDDQSADDTRRAEKECGEYFAHGGKFGSRRVTLKKAGEIGGVQGLHWRIIGVNGRHLLVVSDAYMAIAVCEEYENGWIDRERNISLQHTAPSEWEGIDSLSIAHVWTDVYLKNEYRLPDDMLGMTVLDIGGHEGIFAKACLDRGAAAVVSVEPHPDNFVRLTRNLIHEPRSLRINCAAWSIDTPARTCSLELPESGATSSGGFVVSRLNEPWGAAPRLPIDTICDVAKSFMFQPYEVFSNGTLASKRRIDILKLDCEGSELPIILGTHGAFLRSSEILLNFNYICAELHTAWLFRLASSWGIPDNKKDAIQRLVEQMAMRGFEYHVTWEQENLGHLWAWRRGTDCIFKIEK